MAPACPKKECATPDPGECKHRLQYDGRPMGVWGAGLNVKLRFLCEELSKRMTDVCCLQEVRWEDGMLGME